MPRQLTSEDLLVPPVLLTQGMTAGNSRGTALVAEAAYRSSQATLWGFTGVPWQAIYCAALGMQNQGSHAVALG